MRHRQPQVPDAAGSVRLDEDVLGLDVAVGDGQLAVVADDLGVEVDEAGRRPVRQGQQLGGGEGGALQVVVERALAVVVGDEPQLGAGAAARHVGRVVAEHVVVAQQAGVVDLRLPQPARLVARREDLHSHVLVVVPPTPHLPVPALP